MRYDLADAVAHRPPPAGMGVMAANVRCAGGGQVARDPAPFGLGPTHYERATNGEPCGWKGERFVEAATDPALPPKESIKDWWPRTAALRTAKRCPRCGGRVELIPPPEEVW